MVSPNSHGRSSPAPAQAILRLIINRHHLLTPAPIVPLRCCRSLFWPTLALFVNSSRLFPKKRSCRKRSEPLEGIVSFLGYFLSKTALINLNLCATREKNRSQGPAVPLRIEYHHNLRHPAFHSDCVGLCPQWLRPQRKRVSGRTRRALCLVRAQVKRLGTSLGKRVARIEGGEDARLACDRPGIRQ